MGEARGGQGQRRCAGDARQPPLPGRRRAAPAGDRTRRSLPLPASAPTMATPAVEPRSSGNRVRARIRDGAPDCTRARIRVDGEERYYHRVGGGRTRAAGFGVQRLQKPGTPRRSLSKTAATNSLNLRERRVGHHHAREQCGVRRVRRRQRCDERHGQLSAIVVQCRVGRQRIAARKPLSPMTPRDAGDFARRVRLGVRRHS